MSFRDGFPLSRTLDIPELCLCRIRASHDREQVQRDETMRSCGIAAQTLMLAAKSMGYDSCPMDGFDFDAVGRLINLPEDHVIAMFVAVGKATQDVWPRPGQLPLEAVTVADRF